ncbi:phage baseplate assembly protein V [Nitrosospira sp. Nsp13]|uniref:phage baseplate assembly protein V n=1 Tax=Nitrosospira sp. Nsp13 TaxID=1855332 RepID=UPI00088964F5|nr:phage baseplate assembly protein V [Nitrosospira sp. Nsp13]SCX79693.1 hypothetical protein SAMN05216308_101285 [Nitrosospira sp. Nsp13]
MADMEMERLFEELESRFFGKFRGFVTANDDPLGQGRIQVKVPGVLGEKTLWALPCMPYAGPDIGFLALPPVDANVWVEFEGGDRSHPIWAGCFWGVDELPADVSPSVVIFRTPGATIRIENTGTVEIETTAGNKIVITDDEIKLEAPSIQQSANGGVTEVSASGFDAMNGALKVV